MDVHTLTMTVENSPTILPKILQTIKRRLVNIRSFHADETANKNSGILKIIVESDKEQLRKLKLHLEKLIDVLEVV